MRNNRFYRFLGANPHAIPVILVALIIIFGGITMYLAKHKHPGAKITNLGDAFWWSVVAITTVGYGEYYPITTVGRAIGIAVMFSGIDIVVIMVSIISQKRLQRIDSRLKSKTEAGPRLFADETMTAVKDKIDGIENHTEEDFDTLIIMMKRLQRTLLEESKISTKSSRGCVK